MRDATAGIPPPLDNDDDDVAWALQTAAAQWKRGAFADAIVWLRRAVDSAIQAGHAARANELSGSAWHLTEQMLAHADGAPPAPPSSQDSAGEVDDLLDIPGPPSGEVISIEFEATRTIPDTDTERNLTPSPPAFGVAARRNSSTPVQPRRGLPPPTGASPNLPRPAPAPRPRTGRLSTPAIRPPPPREKRIPAPPPPPPPPEPSALPSFADDEFGRDASDTMVPPESGRDTEAPPEPLGHELPSDRESDFPLLESTRPGAIPIASMEPERIPASSRRVRSPSSKPASSKPVSSKPASSRGPASRGPFGSKPPVSSRASASSKAQAGSKAPAPSDAPPSAEPLLAGVSLADVRGLQDLPEEAQALLIKQARIERLARNDELNGFGVALVLDGWISIMPAIAEVPCARATAGDVVCTWGTLDEAILLSAVAGQDGTAVAVWEKSMLDDATADCPWVADELRLVADRYQTLAGVTMGAMGDRLDESLRAMVTERCEVRALMPGEVLVDKGGVVPGLHIVGAGRIELADGSSSSAEVEDELGPGDFLFAAQVLQGGVAPAVARAGKSGALVLFAERKVAHELLVSVPPLLEIFAT
jgi:hypothetical protein